MTLWGVLRNLSRKKKRKNKTKKMENYKLVSRISHK